MKKILTILLTITAMTSAFATDFTLIDILGNDYMRTKRIKLTSINLIPKYEIDKIFMQEAIDIVNKVKESIGETKYNQLKEDGISFSEIYWLSTQKK